MLRWKTHPSRGGGTHAAGRDGRDGPRDSADGGPWQPATTGDDRQRGSAARAVGMPAVTRGADGEQAVAVSAGLLAERLVHGVRARGASSDWTASTNRGTTAPTGSVCRSSGRSRGSGGTRALTPTSESVPTVSERPGACEHGRRGGSVRSGTGADDDPSSRRRPSHSPLRSHVQPLPLPVPRSATALRKRPRTDVRSAWSSASSESDLNRPAFKFLQEFVSADTRGR